MSRLDHRPVSDPRPFEALRPGILPECLEVDRLALFIEKHIITFEHRPGRLFPKGPLGHREHVDGPIRTLGLRPAFLTIDPRLRDPDESLLEVHIPPLQGRHLTTPHAREKGHLEKRLVKRVNLLEEEV